MPSPLKPHDVRVTAVAGLRSVDCVAQVPHTIISTAMQTGASTGPHQGSGSRKRMSQSNSDLGQPHIDPQEHVIEDVPDAEGDRRVAQAVRARSVPRACRA